MGFMLKDNWRKNYIDNIELSVGMEVKTLIKLHSELIKATFAFFAQNEMQYIPVPATTGSASSPMEPGSDSAPVEIRIENTITKLTDSAQFHLEYGCRAWKQGCFYYGHSFRDEEPDERHLAQFSHAEAEIIGTLDDVKKLVECYVKYVTKSIWVNAEMFLKEVPNVKSRIERLLESKHPFQSISFHEACRILEGHSDVLKKCKKGGNRITPRGERILLKELGDFVWVECWDRMTVPFYQAYDRKREVALNADLLFGIGEVVGAGQRHECAEDLSIALKEHDLSEKDYEWYIAMKKKFPMETSGFGMGVERYLMWLLGIKDIRSLEVFPRSRLQNGLI